VNTPEYQIRFRWRANSIAFWENFSTQHYASADYGLKRRCMERISIAGDRPSGIFGIDRKNEINNNQVEH
jgi:taurine dioxygenase